MSSADPFAAQLLRSSTAAYAGLVARRLLERHPALGRDMGGAPFQTWKEHLEVRLRELATAVEEGRQETFVAQVHWSRAAWTARGVDPQGLRDALGVLVEVLEEELPPPARAIPVACVRAALDGFQGVDPDEIPRFITGEGQHGLMAAEYLKLLFEGDSLGAENLVLGAVRQGRLEIEDAFHHVLEPTMREIGLMWQLGEATVPDEHFATGVTRRLIARLSAIVPPERPNGLTLLAASVARETHDVGLQLVAESFVMAGWKVVNLGADVPVEEIVTAVEQYGAQVLALSATMPTHRPIVARTIEHLRSTLDPGARPRVLVGGLAFAELEDDAWRKIGADGFARDAASAVRVARRLLGLEDEELERGA